MGKAQDRSAALSTLIASQRTQKAAAAAASASFTSTMAGVSVNTIAAGDITALNAAQTSWNAATAAYDAAILLLNAAYRAADD